MSTYVCLHGLVLPGLMKFAGEGSSPYLFLDPGTAKSAISLLNKMPVLDPRTLDPKLNGNSKKWKKTWRQ